MPKSYRINEFRIARRRRQSSSREQTGSSQSEKFLNWVVIQCVQEWDEYLTHVRTGTNCHLKQTLCEATASHEIFYIHRPARTGFDSLRLEVIREGVSVVDSTTSDVPLALSKFTDYVFNLDDIETGIADNMLDVTVRLSVTTDELNAGFRSLFILANSPLPLLDGDFNNDTFVNAADYVVWRKGLGTTYTPYDYYIWRSQFGQTIPGAGSGLDSPSAVPEPATFVTLSIGLLAVSLRSKRLRR